jgi:D-cysteine desulfhydrase
VIGGRALWVKREGDSAAAYGGNKVRTLEPWLGAARTSGARRIWAIGATGSNHAIATLVHARALGIAAGAIVFPQPRSTWARENARAMTARRRQGFEIGGEPIVQLRSVLEVPFAAMWIARERGQLVMPPGGATPMGALGALSAAFELAEQIAAGLAPPPRRIVLPIGSTCTTAGLYAGIALARAVGVWPWPPAIVHGVRVTPWPVTSRALIVRLAARTLALVAQLGGPRAALADAPLVVDGRELGAGYGHVTARGSGAIAAFAAVPGAPRLDGVYAGKAAAALLRVHRDPASAPLLFWATKSTAAADPREPRAT